MATKALARNNYVQASAITWNQSDVLETPNGIHDAIPLLADKTTGRLLVDIGSSVALDNLTVNTDQIEGKQDVTNALLTTTAADLAAVKTQLATGTIAVTGGGGGGGGGGASAAYNSTLPTYTSGASSTLQTDVNGRLITTGPLTDTQLRSSAVPVSAASLPLPSGAATESGNLATIAAEAVIIDNKLPSLSSGRVPVEANNAASQVYNYTATGAVAGTTAVLIGPLDCSQFREVSVQIVSAGTGWFMAGEISNDNTNWVSCPFLNQSGIVSSAQVATLNFYNYQLLGARFFRIRQAAAQTSGTTTIVAYASQQATPKLYQQVTISGNPIVFSTPNVGTSSGFQSYHSLVAAASTNATLVKSSVGVIGSLILTNNSASWAYFKFCNTTSAPTPGTTTAVINIGVAPNSTLDCSTSYAGIRLAGISYYVSAGTSLTDNTALAAAGTFLVNMTYV